MCFEYSTDNDKFLIFNETYDSMIEMPLGQLIIKCDNFVLNEDKHKEVNVGQAALGYLKRNLKYNLVLIDLDVLESKILTSWIHYKDFYLNYKGTRLFLLKTVFKDSAHAAEIIHNVYAKCNLSELKKQLNCSMNGTYALTLKFGEKDYFILIDEKFANNERKIQHEFIHYVQLISKTMVVQIKHKNVPKQVKIYFNLSDNYENYIFNENEFLVNTYVDFFNGLQKIYWSYFNVKKYDWERFIDDQIGSLKNNVFKYRDSLVYKLWISEIKENLFYLDVLACICCLNENLFNQIVEKLKNK